MKIYYRALIIGDGSEEDSFRPAVADYPVAWQGSIESDPITGHPIGTHVIVLVDTNDHSLLLLDPRLEQLIDYAPNTK